MLLKVEYLIALAFLVEIKTITTYQYHYVFSLQPLKMRAAYISSSVLLLLGRLSGSDINAARHLNSLTKVALQS